MVTYVKYIIIVWLVRLSLPDAINNPSQSNIKLKFLQNSAMLIHGNAIQLIVNSVSAGLILGLHPANERRHYKVMPSLTGWVQT